MKSTFVDILFDLINKIFTTILTRYKTPFDNDVKMT